ncbi:peptidylprolyl isomerase [Salirhabdus sp. Marseille-P4669]|uniref:peptidylprolyl isomerase n=1 Tax=Salirhabdus sp. Marseille-P4669 TaxID=2042310 RepID=UPI000C7AEA7A|nr:peptidyl-prolyl cis-trans isomerase [Salirhabdus sp. Marseille-P4669]
MSRRLLWGIIIVLLITNIASILILTNGSGGNMSDIMDEENLPKEVAKVGNDTITADQWIKSLRSAYGEDYLKSLINEKVVFQLAEEYDLAVNEKFMERELAITETASGIISEAEREQLRKEWKDDIQYTIYRDELLTRDIVIDEQEIQNYYSQNQDRFDFETSYQLSHIVVDDENTAESILDALNNGQAFGELAEQYSIDTYTNQNGGYLGYFTNDSTYLQNIYFTALNNLEPGQFSEPFETTEGTVILYLHHVIPEVELAYDDVKKHIRRLLAKQKLKVEPSVEVLWEEVGVEWIY